MPVHPQASATEIQSWLAKAEESLREGGIPEASLLATRRVKLLLSLSGAVPGTTGTGRLARIDADARDIMAETLTTLAQVTAREETQLLRWEDVAAEGIRAAAQAKILFQQRGTERSAWLARILIVMASHPASARFAIRLCAAVHVEDALRVLDRAFARCLV
jgi:hypothetical protein